MNLRSFSIFEWNLRSRTWNHLYSVSIQFNNWSTFIKQDQNWCNITWNLNELETFFEYLNEIWDPEHEMIYTLFLSSSIIDQHLQNKIKTVEKLSEIEKWEMRFDLSTAEIRPIKKEIGLIFHGLDVMQMGWWNVEVKKKDEWSWGYNEMFLAVVRLLDTVCVHWW